MKKIIALFILIGAIGFQLNAQKITEGYVKYEISDIKAEGEEANPQFEMMKGMLQGTITKVFFTKEKSLSTVSAMGGMSMTKVETDKDGNINMYMDVMGQKLSMKMTKEEAEKINKENNPNGKMEYVHHKDKTKKILGYTAHLVEVKVPEDSKDMGKMEFWVTDEIEAQGQVQQGIDNKEIGGFPLEFTISVKGQFTMKTSATEFKKDFDKSVFDFDKKGYKEMTQEELQKMGLGGGM